MKVQKYQISKLQTAWTTIKRQNEEPLETRKVATGETYKRKVGQKQVGWKEVPWYGAAGNGDSNYFGEAYTKPVPVYEDIYEDVPRYREEYLYPEKPKPQLVKRSSTKQYIAPQDNRPHVKVPQQYKEGLATIQNGQTYYKFDGYSPEQVQQAIASIIGKQQPKIQDVYYEPDEPLVQNTVTEESVKQKPSAEEVVAKILGDTEKPADKEPDDKKPEQKSIVKPVETEEVETDLTDKGVFMYKYPRREVHTYNVQPEIAEQVREWLKNQEPIDQENKEQRYIFSDKPLYNLPEGYATDSIFHSIYKTPDPVNGVFNQAYNFIDKKNQIAEDISRHFIEDQIRGGLYRPNNYPVHTLKDFRIFTNYIPKVPGTENLEFIPILSIRDYDIERSTPNTYKWYLGNNYRDSEGRPVEQVYLINDLDKPNYNKYVDVKSADIPTYPYKETVKKLEEQNKVSTQNNDSIKQKAKNFVGSLLNIFK